MNEGGGAERGLHFARHQAIYGRTVGDLSTLLSLDTHEMEIRLGGCKLVGPMNSVHFLQSILLISGIVHYCPH